MRFLGSFTRKYNNNILGNHGTKSYESKNYKADFLLQTSQDIKV